MAVSERRASASLDAAPVAGPLALVPVTLGPVDIGAALALSDAAGWNQTADDWAVFIGRGHTIGRRSADGELVATAAALPYGGGQGWISMVLVADAWRHRGLASRLLDEAVAHLREGGRTPVLDATPAGAAVYRQKGFVAGFEADRWEGPSIAMPRDGGAAAAHAAGPADLDVIAALDRASTGLDRRFLIESFLSRPASKAWRSADGSGFVIARAGRRAMQVGPLVAADDAQAIALLEVALASGAANGRVFLDLARPRREVAAWLEGQGFVRQRPFVRMALGAAEPPALGDGAFVLAGPEFG